LADLVSYNEKHNEANGEDNKDGANDNHSWNHGAEGPTEDPKIIELRGRDMRNMLATMLLSQGVPMICAGDEIARTQRGNNNAYAQDNEISWLDWNLDAGKQALLEFTTNLIKLRKEHPNLHRRKFFQDRKISPSSAAKHKVDGFEVRDIAWYRPDGGEMTEDEWTAGWVRCLGMRLSGRTLQDVDRYGEPIRDDTFLFCMNPHHELIHFYIPPCSVGCNWEIILDTRDAASTEARHIKSGESYDMVEHSAVLFREAVEKPKEIRDESRPVDLAHQVNKEVEAIRP
jgi:isoamylase